ncbi:sugar phosphate nucleotidyltransferase, partial [Stenotrophomonas sp. GbtcB23]|uniref:sugar phosphate nucleotidyltransferase n=1 Tax=Stenotrophomonas sp. GbtcB23 TaxID=2824768 RepID=UPI0020C5C54B
AAFRAAELSARPPAQEGKLATLGIVPTGLETGYGYIKASAGGAVRAVDRFGEKPDAETARRYDESGECYWISGMFLFKACR